MSVFNDKDFPEKYPSVNFPLAVYLLFSIAFFNAT